MGPVTAWWHRVSQIETVRVATNDGQQPTTEYTTRFAGDTPVVFRIIGFNVVSCEPRKTLFMGPENKLIVPFPWNVNSKADRWGTSHFAVSKTA